MTIYNETGEEDYRHLRNQIIRDIDGAAALVFTSFLTGLTDRIFSMMLASSSGGSCDGER